MIKRRRRVSEIIQSLKSKKKEVKMFDCENEKVKRDKERGECGREREIMKLYEFNKRRLLCTA